MAPRKTNSIGLHPVIMPDSGAAPPFVDPIKGFNELKMKHAEVLWTLATLARALIAKHLSDENFQRVIQFAYEQRIITADQLGNFGRVDRTTASRWINGHSAPNTFVQEAVLAKIAEEASIQANQLWANAK